MSEAPPKKEYRHAVENGKINFLSPSQQRLFFACPAKWHFNKVQGKKIPTSKKAQRGTESHGRLETLYKTGVDTLTRLERAILEHLPERGPGLLLEEEFTELGRELEIEGVPLVGKIDQVNLRSSEKVTLNDYKFSGDPRRWAAGAADLARGDTEAGIQMVDYGMWVLGTGTEHYLKIHGKVPDIIELRHVYAAMEGRPDSFPVAVTVTPEQLQREWDTHLRPLVRAMKHVVAEKDVQKVPKAKSEDTCKKYGTCPFLAECKGLGAITKATVSKAALPQGVGNQMSFLNKMIQAAAAAQPVVPVTPAQAPAAPPPIAPPAPAAPPPARVAPATPPAEWSNMFAPPVRCSTALKQQGVYILPSGELYVFLCATQGGYSFLPLTGGTPVLLPEGTPVSYCYDAGPSLAPPQIVPPDAPASDPVAAAARMQSTPTVPASIVPVQVAPAAMVAAPIPDSAPVETEKPKRARAKKDSAAESGQVASARLRIFVNAHAPGLETLPLLTYVEGLIAQILADSTQVGVPDIRFAKPPYDYMKWKGAIALAVKAQPPAPGDYHFAGQDDRVEAALAELQKLCAPGDYIIGR